MKNTVLSKTLALALGLAQVVPAFAQQGPTQEEVEQFKGRSTARKVIEKGNQKVEEIKKETDEAINDLKQKRDEAIQAAVVVTEEAKRDALRKLEETHASVSKPLLYAKFEAMNAALESARFIRIETEDSRKAKQVFMTVTVSAETLALLYGFSKIDKFSSAPVSVKRAEAEVKKGLRNPGDLERSRSGVVRRLTLGGLVMLAATVAVGAADLGFTELLFMSPEQFHQFKVHVKTNLAALRSEMGITQ